MELKSGGRKLEEAIKIANLPSHVEEQMRESWCVLAENKYITAETLSQIMLTSYALILESTGL
jgi:hypothetical protein